MMQGFWGRALILLLLVALVSGLGTALYLLLADRRSPSVVVDASAGDRLPVAPAVPLDTPGQSRIANVGDDEAAAMKLCRGEAGGEPAALFGHIKQSETTGSALVSAPAGFNVSNCALIHRDMATALSAMISAARNDDASLGRNLVGISCFRSHARQRDLYCRADRLAERGYAGQAYWVAPPGYSEHATGRAIDFGDRSRPDCNVSPCFGSTPVGRWLAANAGRFGFVLSFPEGNAQGVSFEPWHYRYVGGAVPRAASSRETHTESDEALPMDNAIIQETLPDGSEVIRPN